MKSKRRTTNTDTKMCPKKIITRNVQNKISEEKVLSVNTNCQHSLSTKPSLNTRAKSSSGGKLDFDPYLFSKVDEESKLPLKKMKMTEKNCKDVSVNTCDFTTMTDPMMLGPCEPGTSIELRGIVWLETITGLLVINVTWRGRTYVGTLLDSTKYEFTPPLNSPDVSGKFENCPTTKANRGRKRYSTTGTTYPCSNRPTNIRHSRRLIESLSYTHNNRKSSVRTTNNDACYAESFPQSGDPSFSGESDSDLINYQKCLATNKTRSVTRSVAKQVKSIGDSDNDICVKCSQMNCFKEFADRTALTYHLQLCHGVFEENIKMEKVGTSEDKNVESIKLELTTDDSDHEFPRDKLHPQVEGMNGKILKKTDDFEFNSDMELKVEVCVDREETDETDIVNIDSSLVKFEPRHTQLMELSVSLPKLSVDSPRHEQPKPPNESSLNTEGSDLNPLATTVTESSSTQPIHISPKSSATDVNCCQSLTAPNTLPRTITAPTVTIPTEVSASVTTSVALVQSPMSSTLIKPKPSQVPLNATSNLQSKKLKPNKLSLQIDTNTPSTFQIPSTSVQSKKRPLVPNNMSSYQPLVMNQNRLLPNSTSLNSVPSNHNRPSPFTNITPILPATSIYNSVSQVSSTSISPLGSVSTVNSQTNTKRISNSANNLSPTGMNSLLSLKPIQPKPKSSTNLPTYPNTTPATFVNQIQPVTVPCVLPNQTSYQRQILPNPMSKFEPCSFTDDRCGQKIDTIPAMPVKKKRRKSDKKLRLNIHECQRLKKSSLNPIQPKQGNDGKESKAKDGALLITEQRYKIDDENSHSPEYSDLSETNDTPAPILEKEIELRSLDCDKLVICTDFDTTTNQKVSSSGSDQYDEGKDTKPPALMPAVLSTDLLNGSTNDVELSECLSKTVRKKPLPQKLSQKPSDKINDLVSAASNCVSKLIRDGSLTTHLKVHHSATSSRKSFQSSTVDEKTQTVQTPSSSSKTSLYISSTFTNNNNNNNQSPKLSAINDYVWRTKNNHEGTSNSQIKADKISVQAKSTQNDNCTKNAIISAQSQLPNGKFSVQAISSPQEIVSRSFPSSSAVISVNPNTKLASTLFKN